MTKINKNIKIGATNKIFTMKNMNIELRDTLRKSGMNGRAAETLAIILTNFHNDMMELKSSVESGFKELKKDMDARFENVETRLSFIESQSLPCWVLQRFPPSAIWLFSLSWLSWAKQSLITV